MRTKLVIVGIVAGCAAPAIAVAMWLLVAFGLSGAAVIAGAAAAVWPTYVWLVRPWHAAWGATPEEVRAWLPGDGIVLGAATTTRAIWIDAPPEEVWPWLIQIGYGRAGWYSYDWIDNDGRPSADRIVPQLQNLRAGDTIEMLPGWGPTVREVERNSHFVAGGAEDGTWCLALRRGPGGTTRLISRWRQAWKPKGAAARFFVALSDPGAFVMERKMLLGIKERAERAALYAGIGEAA